MKNNFLCHFAIKDLKKHHKDTLISFITLTCLAIVCTLITAFTPLFANQKVIDYQKQYGTCDYFSNQLFSLEEFNQMEVSLQNEKMLLKESDLQYCYKQHIGDIVTNGSIDYITGDYEIMAIQLKEGRMPQEDNEIAVKESVLEGLGYLKNLHHTIEIPYYDDHGYHVGKWIIVGVLESTGESSILMGAPVNSQNFQVYIDTKGQYEIDNADDLGMIETLDENRFADIESINALVVMVQFVLFIIGCIILSGMTIAAFENRKDDYALLRGIGATKRQLYFIVFLQSLFLIVSSLVMTLMISWIIIMVISACVETVIPLKLQFSYFNGIIVIVSLMTLVSYFMPARSACHRALTGAFEGNEFQYFYYRYKKLHHMRPFYLGWRQLVNHKKQMIVKIVLIFIASLMMMKIIKDNIYTSQLQQQKQTLIEPQSHHEISLTYHPNDEKISYIAPEDLKSYESYAKDIRYFHRAEYEDYSGFHNNIYCYDENIKKEFDIQKQLQPGEVIVSQGFRSFNSEDVVVVQGDTYKIVSEIEDSDIFIIMSLEDFQKYGDLKHYQLAKVYFHDIHQKTKGLIAYAKNNPSFQYYWDDSLQTEQLNMNLHIEESAQKFPIIEFVVMLGAGLIYVYQLSYEIFKQRETIGTYQLLGVRKWEIWRIYAYKSMLIALIGLLLAIYYHFADIFLNQTENEQWLLFLTPHHLFIQMIPAIVLVILFIGLSLLPIYSLLKKDGLENKNMRE